MAPGEHSVPADSLGEGDKRDIRAGAIKTNRQIFYSNSIFSSQITFKEFFSSFHENVKEDWLFACLLSWGLSYSADLHLPLFREWSLQQ